MRAEQVIVTLLNADAAVAALVGTRIYPGELPQECPYPAIAYVSAGGNEEPPIDAATGRSLVTVTIRVAAFASAAPGASGYAQVKALLDAVRAALSFKSGQISGTQVVSVLRSAIGADSQDDEIGAWWQSHDYDVTFYE